MDDPVGARRLRAVTAAEAERAQTREPSATHRPARGSGSRRDDLRLDCLVLRIRDQPGIEHLLGILETPDRVGSAPGRTPWQRGTRAHLDAARARAQLLELADPALLAPGLILRLADPIHRLRLGFDAGP